MDWYDFTTGYACGSILTMLIIMIGLPWRTKEE